MAAAGVFEIPLLVHLDDIVAANEAKAVVVGLDQTRAVEINTSSSRFIVLNVAVDETKKE